MMIVFQHDFATLLVERNANVVAANVMQSSLLMIVEDSGHVGNASLLFDRKANVNAANGDQWTS
jgi:ankyrin repeat protein